MKKLFALIFFVVILSGTAAAQSNDIPEGKQTEQYCLVIATGKLLSTKVNISLDYGQEQKWFSDKRVKDEQGKAQTFNSVVDALNFMNSQGWEFVNAYAIWNGQQNVFNYLMRRKVI